MEILEELLQRSKTIEQRLSDIESMLEEKADKVAVSELERRIESVENRFATDDAEMKLLNERMNHLIETTFSQTQHGFVPSRSCSTHVTGDFLIT